jgi:hypothetical protein
MKDSIWSLTVLLLFLSILVPAFGLSYTNSVTTTHTVANEAVSISTETWTSVEEEGATYYDNETVYHDGSTVSETEYRWATTNGSIRAVENGTLDEASQVSVTYSYDRHNKWTRVTKNGLYILFAVFGVLILFIGAGVLLTATKAFGSGGGGR